MTSYGVDGNPGGGYQNGGGGGGSTPPPTSNVGEGMGPGYHEGESGVPGGWGAKESSGQESGGSVTTTPSGGTYTDAQGRPITREQAILSGRTDAPGVSQFERIQGLSHGSGPTPPPLSGPPPELQPTGPKPGEYGYHATPNNPAGLLEEIGNASKPPQTAAPVFVRGIGWMVPRELVEAGKLARQNKPMTEERPVIGLPSVKISREPTLTGGIEKAGIDLAQKINTKTEGQNSWIQGAGRVTGNVIAGTAIIPSALEVTGRTLITDPGSIPALAIHGAVKIGEETNEAFQKNPIETAATLYLGGKVFQAGGKALDVIKVGKIETTPAAASRLEPLVIKPGQMGPGSPGWGSLNIPTEGTIQTSKTLTILPGRKGPTTWAPTVAAAAAPAVVYQGVSLEAGRKSQPLLGVTEGEVTNKLSLKIGDKTIVAGTPKFKPETVQEYYGAKFQSKEGYEYFTNPTEMKIARENIVKTYDPATQQLFTDTMAKRELTYGTPATHKLSDVPLEDVLVKEHGLKPETAANVRKYMQGQKDFIIWGSTANKALVMGEGGVGYFRQIGDIDLHVKNPAVTSQELFNIIGKTEAPGTVTTKGAAGLSTGKGTLFDIKNIEGGAPEGTVPGSQPSIGDIFGFKREPTETVGKFQTVSLSEQTTSKLSSVALRENTISAHAGRAGKDPFDLAFINEPAQTLGLEQSWNPYTRYVKAPKARALDAAIQERTIAKVKSQPEGSAPGQITTEQKAVFFENVEAMKAGKTVTSNSEPTLLYSTATKEQGLTAARLEAYGIAVDYSAIRPGSINQVIPPHSPVKVRTDQGKRGAEEIARNIADQYNFRGTEGPRAVPKGPDVYTDGGDKLINTEYFNRGKVDAVPAARFDKSFGSESMTGSPKNALSSNYYGSLNMSPSLSGGDAGTYTPQNPYYDVPGTYPGSPGYGSPYRYPNNPGYPGRGYGGNRSPGSPPNPRITVPKGWKIPGPEKRKKTSEEKKNKAKIPGQSKYFRGARVSPIAAASIDLSNVRKSLGLNTTKPRKSRKSKKGNYERG